MFIFYTGARQFSTCVLLALATFITVAIAPNASATNQICVDAFDLSRPAKPVEHRNLNFAYKANRPALRTAEDFATQMSLFRTHLTATEQTRLLPLNANVDQMLENLENPYSIEHSMAAEAKSIGNSEFEDAFDLISILVKDSDSISKAKSLNAWTQSEAHALLAYDYLYKEGLLQEQPVYEWLLANSLYYTDALPVRGPPNALITFAFEKEGNNKDISLLYRDPAYSDQEWMNLSETTRLELLKKKTSSLKKFLSADKIAPTSLKPEYLSGFSEELPSPTNKEWGWEISNKRYEFSLPRLMSQIHEVSKLFKATHSFHAHVVFEISKKYPYFREFAGWVKHVNDYLYLKGMEEGLHGNYLTDIAEKAPVDIFSKWWSSFRAGSSAFVKTVPHKLSLVTYQSHKFFSMGVRAGLYGDAQNPENQKLGLELRDTTRNLDALKRYMELVSASVSKFRWESAYQKKGIDNQIQLTKDPAESLRLLKTVVDDTFAKRLIDAEPSAALGLIPFEQGQKFNYQTGNFETISPEVDARILSARQNYIKSLINLELEVRAFDSKGEKIEDADFAMAIKMSLSEWAKLAKASELYSKF